MRPRLLLTAALCLSACAPRADVAPRASATAKPRPAIDAPSKPPIAPAAVPATAPELDRSVFEIPLPARTVCTVAGASPGEDVTLLLGEGLTIGDVAGAELRVHIPHDDDIRDRFVVEAELPGVSLRAFAGRYSTRFHPTKAAIFEFLVPRANALLTVRSATEDEIRLRLPLPRRVGVGPFSRGDDASATVEGVLPCDALSLDVKPFDPFVALSEAKGQGALTQQTIGLASKPGGSVVGRVRLERDSDAPVTVLEREEGWVKVAYPTEEAVVFGWIRRQLVVPSAPQLAPPQPLVDAGRATASGSPRRIMVCSHALPFRAKVAGRELTVGIVHPREVIPIVRAEVGRRRIDLANHGLRLDRGAELWVADADVKDCREQGP